MSGLTKEQAIVLHGSGFWETMTAREIATFQLFERSLCMPFPVFRQALEEALGRPVWTHEMGPNCEGLKAELLGERPAPSFEEIIALIPEEKRLKIKVVN